jgi:ribosomal protein S27AE
MLMWASADVPPLEPTGPSVRDSVRIARIQHRASRGGPSRADRGQPGGAVAKKKYDPLWAIVEEKIALQGREPDVDVPCPQCHVTVHLGPGAKVGERYACGLCGEVCEVVGEPGGRGLRAVNPA